MFHKEDFEAYKSIKAPKELREKVLMASEDNAKMFPYRQLYLAMASFAVIVGLSATWNWNHSFISIKGNEQMISMVSETRGVPETSISVEITSSNKRKLTVSDGSLLLKNQSDGQKSLWVEPETELLWQLNAQTDQEYELSVTGWGKDKLYLLSYNQEHENWEMKEQ